MDNNKCVPFVIMLCENCHVFFHFCISSSHAPTVPLMGNWCCPWIGRLNAVFWLSCNMSLPLSLYEKGGEMRYENCFGVLYQGCHKFYLQRRVH